MTVSILRSILRATKKGYLFVALFDGRRESYDHQKRRLVLPENWTDFNTILEKKRKLWYCFISKNFVVTFSEVKSLYDIIQTLLIIDSVVIIIAVMMQPTKQQDALNALSGGGGELFGQTKKPGFEAVMEKVTAVLGVIFFVLAIILVYLSSH